MRLALLSESGVSCRFVSFVSSRVVGTPDRPTGTKRNETNGTQRGPPTRYGHWETALKPAARPRSGREQRLHRVRLDGLDDVMIEPGFARPPPVFLLAPTCQSDPDGP